MNGGEPVVVVPIESWERLRRMVQHVSLVRDQLTHVAEQLDRVVGLRNALDYLPTPNFGPEIDALHLPVPTGASSRRHVNLWFEPAPSGLVGYLTYRTDMLTRTVADRIVTGYRDDLHTAATRPDTQLAALSSRHFP